MTQCTAEQCCIRKLVSDGLLKLLEVPAHRRLLMSEPSPGRHVIDGVTNRLQVLEVFILDTEISDPRAECLLKRLDKFDESK